MQAIKIYEWPRKSKGLDLTQSPLVITVAGQLDKVKPIIGK